MSHSTLTRLKQWWKSRSNAAKISDSGDTKHSKHELLGRRRMENTPFDIVGESKKGYFGALGKYRITEGMPTEKDVEEYINKNMYNIVLLTMQILIPAEVKHQLKEHLNPQEENEILNTGKSIN